MSPTVSFEDSRSERRFPRVATSAAITGLILVALVAASRGRASELGKVGTAAASAIGGASPAGSAFWAHWGDGRAELNGYRLTQPRYGAAREGTVVHVFVTEPFSYEARVKADPGRHPDSDVFQVLKLNAMKDFQTGIYDYNIMTSVFVPLEEHPRVRVGHPTKLTFSSQEWCGMLFEQLRFEPKRVDQVRKSYFDGEGEQSQTLSHPQKALTVDELPIFLRGLTEGLPLKPGQTVEVPMLPSVERARLIHRDLDWVPAKLSREAKTKTVKVPAGTFEVVTYAADLSRGDRYVYHIETAPPRRVVGWEGPDGERAELTGTARLPYWSLNGPGEESYLKALGLKPPQNE